MVWATGEYEFAPSVWATGEYEFHFLRPKYFHIFEYQLGTEREPG